MANSFTRSYETVMGSCRVLIGTLAMADGAAGSEAGTGMNNIWLVLGSSSQTTKYTFTVSSILGCTAASGGSAQVIVFGT
jgi:hypothetical protein